MGKNIITDRVLQEESESANKVKEETNKIKEEYKEKKQRQEKKEEALRRSLIIVFVILAVLSIIFAKVIFQYLSLKKEKEETQNALDALQNKVTELENTLELVNSKEYIETQARVLLKMIYPNELRIIVEDDE